MKDNEQNFDDLKRLLKLKRHEIPPPGYFNNFSANVIERIRADEAGHQGTPMERIQAQASWLAKLLSIFELKPAMVGGFATALVLLLMIGVVVSEKSNSMSGNSFADSQIVPAPTPVSMASISSPLLTDGGGGIQVSTNAGSLQPVGNLFGQQNPLLQSASFVSGH